ncbi:hypothetical protein MASR1M59_15470 [Melaminivora sp.]
MPKTPLADLDHSPDNEYEDLLGQWSDLEAFAGTLLTHPTSVQGFCAKVRQCEQWLDELAAHDIDAALYLMFQLASTSTVGYSASHALVCAALCHVLAHELALPQPERSNLVCAAFTMNIGMTALQDELALQHEPLSLQQRLAVQKHPQISADLLEQLDVRDELWLDAVAMHHQQPSEAQQLAQLQPAERLTRILATIDRYAAMISPRKSRSGRSVTDSVRAIISGESALRDEIGLTLVRSIGLCPPGTFVRLDNGEIAAVLRRGAQAQFPLVASVLDAHGQAVTKPRLYHTETEGAPRILTSLARSALALEVNHRTMVRLGLFAARPGGAAV